MGKEKRVWIKACQRCDMLLATLDIACWPPCRLCGWPGGEADDLRCLSQDKSSICLLLLILNTFGCFVPRKGEPSRSGTELALEKRSDTQEEKNTHDYNHNSVDGGHRGNPPGIAGNVGCGVDGNRKEISNR